MEIEVEQDDERFVIDGVSNWFYEGDEEHSYLIVEYPDGNVHSFNEATVVEPEEET